MELLHVILIIAAFLIICGLFFMMQRAYVSFNKRVLLALFVGLIFGLAVQMLYEPDSYIVRESMAWVNIVGSGFISLLKMLIIPLVLFSILSAFTSSEFSHKFGRYAGLVLGMLALTVMISGAVGLVFAGLFNLGGMEFSQGSQEILAISENTSKIAVLEGMTTPQKLVYMLPTNIFSDLAESKATSVIAVVIFASILGMAYMGVRRKEPEKAEMFAKIIEAMLAVVMRMVVLILRITPYGILALIARMTATSDLAIFWELGKFIVASYLAILVMYFVHMLILRFAGLNPITYIKKIVPVTIFAFSSRSSAGALPMNLATQKESLGVPKGIADIAGAFSLTIGQNGCAGIYPAMLAVMAATSVGIDPFTIGFIIMLLLAVVIGSFGIAGVGGGATFAALIVLSTMGLPVAIVGLLISIEPLIDMARTALNVSGGMVSGVITSRLTKELDVNIYNSNTMIETSQHI